MLVVWLCNTLRGQVLVLLAMPALLLLLLAFMPPLATPPPSTPSTAASTAAPEQSLRPAAGAGALLTRALYVPGFARPHAELCPLWGARLQLLILVASAPGHAAARRSVRYTWGHAALRHDVAVGFVLGAPPPALRAALDREDALYGDLIEGRSWDSYTNLTLKSVSMLEWKQTYCPRAPFLLKVDDDVFVSVERLLQFAAGKKHVGASNTVWGALVSRALPHRAPRDKNFAPPEQFPGPVFPDYVRGPAYLVSADAARRLAHVAGRARYLQVEDVFVTGVLAGGLGVRRVQPRGFLRLRLVRDACEVRRWVAMHLMRHHDMLDVWTKSIDSEIKCRVQPPV